MFFSEIESALGEEVINRHIDLYVNRYSVELGEEGKRAVKMLFARSKAAGLMPQSRARHKKAQEAQMIS